MLKAWAIWRELSPSKMTDCTVARVLGPSCEPLAGPFSTYQRVPALPGLTLYALPQPGRRYVVGADPADQQLAPIPDIYIGSWWRHGSSLSIRRPDGFPAAGNVIAQWRTYTFCQDPVTKKTNPPPCDMVIGNLIANGGLASIALLHPEGQDDKNISGVVTATTDPSVFGKQGADAEFTMLPGNMLLVMERVIKLFTAHMVAAALASGGSDHTISTEVPLAASIPVKNDEVVAEASDLRESNFRMSGLFSACSAIHAASWRQPS